MKDARDRVCDDIPFEKRELGNQQIQNINNIQDKNHARMLRLLMLPAHQLGYHLISHI